MKKIKIILANILITGATGFIGSNLVHQLVKSKDKISIFTHKKSNMKHIKNIISKLDIHEVDFCEYAMIQEKIKKIKPDIVYHLATYGVLSHQTEFDKIIQTNIIGTLNLFNALSEYGCVNKVVNLGSSFEYEPKSTKIKNTDETNPQTVYGLSKVGQTNIAKYFYEQKDLPVITLRIFNAYGPFENKNRLIPSFMFSALNHKKIYINNPNNIRDFIFVKDVVESLVRASKIKKSGEILNIGTSKGYSVREIVKKLSNITKYHNIIFCESTSHEYAGKIVADITKSKSVLKWEPKYSIDEGLRETFEFLK